jgi:SAM-dependent methyltransferase
MTEAKTYPPVLDACCGSRMFWFDRMDSRAVYVDKRREKLTIDSGTPGTVGRNPVVVNPDHIADFSDLPFPNDTFEHVVFDPPHMYNIGDNSITAKKYGKLIGDWRDMLRAGFSECFRVLRPGGTLIFKWCEYDVPVSEVLALTTEKPLYGHRSGKQSKTHWIAFLKPNKAMEKKEGGK